ncbi:Tn3 family transposase [Nonomuraea purpurea]|uniref:Tn3 family transposase n=1 Tax=Nonomuraea purpurea TaxID=1849276 RepID=A0ABV8GQG3_9ACTN
MQHLYFDLGSTAGGACFEVELRDSTARVCLMDADDYQAYLDNDEYLLPRIKRIKRINRVKMYQADHGDLARYPNLAPAMTRPIRWDIIAANYDQVIKYATAIRTRTASTEAILSRFTRTASHPAYQAILQIGRAARATFVARYLRDRDLQREIEEGLNVVEAWNRANAVLCYGRGGEISTNRRDEVEMTALCLSGRLRKSFGG